MAVAKNIKKLRKKMGWSQADLGEKIHSHASHINRIETGKYNPSLEVLLRIADAFEVNLDALVRGREEDFQEVKIEDKSLAQRIKLVDSLDPEDRQALVRVIDSMLTKKKILHFITHQGEELESVGK